MSKPRCECSAGEAASLLEDLAYRMSGMALTTQPEVAARVVELVSSGDAGLGDFARVIEKDPSLTGRLLKLSNSAYFAQRGPVTRIDRACVLLGLERIRAISLGFYLSRSADAASQLSRRVWGESIYRACLASELSQGIDGVGTAEAFLVGLLMDCGLPLMPRLLETGDGYSHRCDLGYDASGWTHCPEEVFEYEWSRLPFTHVDAATAMARTWNLPETLAKPVAWHHTRASGGGERSQQGLHLLAYYAGSIVLDPDLVQPIEDADDNAAAAVGLDADSLRGCYQRAGAEYKAVLTMFSDVADSVSHLERIQESASTQLVAIVERTLDEQRLTLDNNEPLRFDVGGVVVELDRGRDGRVTAYRRDDQGNRLVSLSFVAGTRDEAEVLYELGVEVGPGGVPELFREALRALAA